MAFTLQEGVKYQRRDGLYTSVQRIPFEASAICWRDKDGTQYHETGIVAGNLLPTDPKFRPTGKDIVAEVKK